MLSMSAMHSIHPQPNRKKEGDISVVFASLSGQAQVELPPRFSELKRTIVGTSPEAQQRLRESFSDVLDALKVGLEEIQARGVDVIPEVSFSDLTGGRGGSWVDEIKRRGVIVVRDVVDDAEALNWKEDIKEYVRANPQVKGFPAENKQVFELYWSKSQLAARSHPNVLAVQKSLLQQLCHAETNAPVSLGVPVTYADRLRIRLPGDSKFALGPHIDGGSLERWEDVPYRGCYEEILSGRWRDHDAWDVGRRLEVTNDLYQLGTGQCNVFRAFQGWLSMSTTGPGEGTLRVFPLLKEASAYVLLRPFFRPTVPPSSPSFLSAASWELDLTSTEFPNSVMGMPQELREATHPHLRLDAGGMVSVKTVHPGDMVFWHCDTIHAVEKNHGGQGDSSVMYIPVVPLTTHNAHYLVRQRAALLSGAPGPDFPGEEGEREFLGVGREGDIAGAEARRASGLQPYVEAEGMTLGERVAVNESNVILAF